PGDHSIKQMTVTAETSWNQPPGGMGTTIWTSNGLSLDSVTFYDGIENGKPLYKTPKKQEYPVFRSDMLPNEVMETFESTMTKITNSNIHSTFGLRPVTFGGVPGFQFEYTFTGQDSVPRKGIVGGAIRDGKLYMIVYEGAATHYYGLHEAEAQRMIAGVRLK
ncbi:MAG: hypothetical protein AB7E69_11205, partial [Sphingomonadales bacterium]